MKETHFLNAVGEKLRFTKRIVPALLIGVLITEVVLLKNSGKRSPKAYGGWRELDLSEFTNPVEPIDALAEVIPLHQTQQVSPERQIERRVIGVEDIPEAALHHPSADLRALPPLIDEVDPSLFTEPE